MYNYEWLKEFFGCKHGIFTESYTEFCEVLEELADVGFNIGFDAADFTNKKAHRIYLSTPSMEIHASFDESAYNKYKDGDMLASDFLDKQQAEIDIPDINILYDFVEAV